MVAIRNHSSFFKKPNVFYGYWVVMAAFFCLFITSGCGFFAFSLFVKPIEADLGWGRGEIMVAFSIFLLVMGVASPFIGRVIDRYGARKIITIGALIMGLGFVLLSRMDHLWYFYLSYIVIGIGMAATGHVPASAIVSNWFEKRRGVAIGIMSTGIGAGGFALSPLIGGYLIPDFGWRVSYLILAALIWVFIIPLASFVVKTKPADMGLSPDGVEGLEREAVTGDSPLPTRGVTLKMALATSGFWLAAVSYLTGGFSSVGVVQNLAPYLEDIGFPAAMAASAFGGVGLGSLIGKFIFGWCCDRVPAKYVYSIALGLSVVGTIMLMSIKPTSPPVIIWLHVLVMGLAAGGWLPTMSMLISTHFGLTAYGTIFGMINFAHSIGVATGPFMAGYMYDNMGSYYRAFIVFLTLYVVSIPTIMAVRRPESL